MPLVWSGRLEAGALAPGAVLERSRRRFEGLPGARLDVFVACDRPRALEHAARLLPEGFDGFWMDVGARASAAELPTYREWARTLRGGALRLRSLAPGREHEVAIGLWPPPLAGVDEDPRPARAWLAYTEAGPQLEERPERRRLAAARVRRAYGLLERLAGGALPPFAEWMAARRLDVARIPADDADRSPVDPAPDAPAAGEIEVRSLELEGLPVTLHVEAPLERRDFLLRVHAAWLGLLDAPDALELRCRDTRERLAALNGELRRAERERGALDTYGVTTLHRAAGLAPEVAAALCADPEIAGGLLGWGLRWSGLSWPLPVAARGVYFCRAERHGSGDRLRVELGCDDPDDARVVAARRALAEALAPDLGEARDWQFEPAAAARYAELVAGLRAAVESVAAEPGLPPPSTEPPGWRGWFERTLAREPAWLRQAFPERVRRALGAAFPEFRQDRTAHPTEAYFLDFVRRTDHGFHYIQIARTQPAPGHRVRLGVSLHRARLDELEAGPGQASHGIVFGLEALCPGRAPLAWSYRQPRALDAALAETVALLRARALPCFARADAVLAAARSSEASDAC